MRTSRSCVPSNPDTVVVVQAFAPYAAMVQMNLPYWRQHNCPVVVVSPVDSPCIVNFAECVTVGKEAWAGPKSLDRWREMLRWMLTLPQKYVMMHESDSICLSRQIPRYCYDEPDVLWSNEMLENAVPPTQQFYSLAPWFMSKTVIEQILATTEQSPDRPPFHGDRWVGQMAEVGGIPHKRFNPGIGCGTLRPGPELEQVAGAVIAGAVMIHGVKHADVRARLLQAHQFGR